MARAKLSQTEKDANKARAKADKLLAVHSELQVLRHWLDLNAQTELVAYAQSLATGKGIDRAVKRLAQGLLRIYSETVSDVSPDIQYHTT